MEYKDRDREFKETRQNILNKKLSLDHAQNRAVLDGIKNVNPKYASHMAKMNEFVMNFAMKQAGGIEILEQPVCRRCEGVALWDRKDSKGNERGYCMSCHVHTVNPYTLKQYLLDQIKGFSKEKLELMLEAQKNLKEELEDEKRIIT